jgi:hypothetical protein
MAYLQHVHADLRASLCVWLSCTQGLHQLRCCPAVQNAFYLCHLAHSCDSLHFFIQLSSTSSSISSTTLTVHKHLHQYAASLPMSEHKFNAITPKNCIFGSCRNKKPMNNMSSLPQCTHIQPLNSRPMMKMVVSLCKASKSKVDEITCACRFLCQTHSCCVLSTPIYPSSPCENLRLQILPMEYVSAGSYPSR